MCKSHTQSNVDLAEVIRLNKILRKKKEAKEPLPQQVPAVEEQVTAKSIVDACYLVIYGRTRKLNKSGFLPIKFAFRPRMN